MCPNWLQHFEFVGEPLPKINMFFKNQKDGKMPGDLHKELSMKDVKGYKENVCKILTVELSPEGWNRCQPIFIYLHEGGGLQKLPGVRAYVSVLPVGGE